MRDFTSSHHSKPVEKAGLNVRHPSYLALNCLLYSASVRISVFIFQNPLPAGHDSGGWKETVTASWSEIGHATTSQSLGDRAGGEYTRSNLEAYVPSGRCQVNTDKPLFLP
ncbi:hypothetical protein HOLleu_00674 [Holothuria leucospilota]|uniref:Uncharacterized protein n=1 Tax=Holothuria leucospilota TaxID=206669 RepID=A0A9Q1CPS8_HOLLE|nr:hypothetical protein HOLleu_00674 [Holothuria leucospilota]